MLKVYSNGYGDFETVRVKVWERKWKWKWKWKREWQN